MFQEVDSHFANVPSIDIQRSKIRFPVKHLTAGNIGQVLPIYVDQDILPGDTVKITHSFVLRFQTMLTPIFDDLVADIRWFFVPYRLVWNHWREFMQENTSGPWAPSQSYQIPSISAPSGGFAVGSLADYMGLPVGVSWSNTDKNAPSALPFRAYAKIVNEFWRDENVSYPLNIPDGDSNQTGTNGTNYINDVANGGMPFVAARTHDFFSSCLPSAQKASSPVTFPLLSNSKAPVIAGAEHLVVGNPLPTDFGVMNFVTSSGGNFAEPTPNKDIGFHKLTDGNRVLGTFGSASGFTDNWITPSNLWADLSSNVGAVTVNELRLAFQLQKWYERAATGGSRYTELIRSMFSVVSPDARLQRPEYLGGNRTPVVVSEVTNTSSDSGSSSVPLGATGAKSNTSNVNVDFVHSFTEHGILMCLLCVRQAHHTYGQGIERQWLRKTWTDFYWPVFAHLGEMPVKEVSIYADGYMDSDDVFGYNEAWAEYRQRPSFCSSVMRPGVSGSLASWHLADYYTQAPVLSDSWMREPVSNVDRTLAVTSAISNQWFGDFYFQCDYTRPMPVYSVPGLIDHW